MLSLPGFLLTSGSIIEHAIKYSSSEPLFALQDIPVLESIPKLWIFLVGNMLTQYPFEMN